MIDLKLGAWDLGFRRVNLEPQNPNQTLPIMHHAPSTPTL